MCVLKLFIPAVQVSAGILFILFFSNIFGLSTHTATTLCLLEIRCTATTQSSPSSDTYTQCISTDQIAVFKHCQLTWRASLKILPRISLTYLVTTLRHFQTQSQQSPPKVQPPYIYMSVVIFMVVNNMLFLERCISM